MDTPDRRYFKKGLIIPILFVCLDLFLVHIGKNNEYTRDFHKNICFKDARAHFLSFLRCGVGVIGLYLIRLLKGDVLGVLLCSTSIKTVY
jgi:hypothetical protein